MWFLRERDKLKKIPGYKVTFNLQLSLFFLVEVELIVSFKSCVSFKCTTLIQLYITHIFFRFFSIICYCKILNIVPCSIQWVYLFSIRAHSVTQSCPTLCKPPDCSPPGSSAHGIFQARILEWIAIPFSSGSSWPRGWTHISCISCIAGEFFTTEPPGSPFYIQ